MNNILVPLSRTEFCYGGIGGITHCVNGKNGTAIPGKYCVAHVLPPFMVMILPYKVVIWQYTSQRKHSKMIGKEWRDGNVSFFDRDRRI